MVLVVALPELAERIAEIIDGEKAYAVNVKDDKALRHKVHSYQPEIVLLDVRILGTKTKAIEQVPAIRDSVRSKPDVIALVPWLDAGVKRQAAALECYGAINFNGKAFVKELRLAVAAALVSRSRLPADDDEDDPGPSSLH